MNQITQNMQTFIEKNKINKVIFGERRTSRNKPAIRKADLDYSDRVFYKLDDGSQFTLTSRDVRSAPDFRPNWDI